MQDREACAPRRRIRGQEARSTGQMEGGVGKVSGSALCLRFAEGEGGPTHPGARPPFHS